MEAYYVAVIFASTKFSTTSSYITFCSIIQNLSSEINLKLLKLMPLPRFYCPVETGSYTIYFLIKIDCLVACRWF